MLMMYSVHYTAINDLLQLNMASFVHKMCMQMYMFVQESTCLKHKQSYLYNCAILLLYKNSLLFGVVEWFAL